MPLPAAAAAAAAAGCGRAPLATAVSEPTVTCGGDDSAAATGLTNVEPCAAAATNAACWLISCCNTTPH